MYSLDDTFDISGEWWNSANPERMVPGNLSFDRDAGIELRINQAFDPQEGAVRTGDANPRYACVHGITVKGEAVTLIDAQQLGTSFNFGSGGLRQPGRIHARILVMGAQLPAGFGFPEVGFRIPGLQVWLAEQVISHEMHFDGNKKLVRQDYSAGIMPEETFQVPSISSEITIQYGLGFSADAYSSIQVSVAAWFNFRPKSSQQADWFLDQEDKLLTLISLLAGELLFADAVHAKIDETNHRVSILFAAERTEVPLRRNPSDYFMSRGSISVPLVDCIANWFDIVSRVEQPASLAKSIMASKNLWLHMEFLSLIQVLEGFHRSLHDGEYLDSEDYDTVRSTLQGAIPSIVSSDHRAALKSRIRYGNQYSLRKRLGELASSLSECIRGHLFGFSGSLPASWLDTRNYYTHWDEELRPGILNIQDMYYANVRLRHFLCTMFRLLVGVPQSDCERAFTGSSHSAQQLIQINIIEKRTADLSFLPHAIMTISSSKDDSDERDESKGGELKGDQGDGD